MHLSIVYLHTRLTPCNTTVLHAVDMLPASIRQALRLSNRSSTLRTNLRGGPSPLLRRPLRGGLSELLAPALSRKRQELRTVLCVPGCRRQRGGLEGDTAGRK